MSELEEHGDVPLSLSYLEKLGLPGSARVLDIGTRFGSLVNSLSKVGFGRVFGIDIQFSLLRRGLMAYPRMSGRLCLYDGVRLPFPGARFDAVTMFDVLEHIPEPSTFLGEVSRVLRPGGRLIFQTPNKRINVPWEILKDRSLTRWRQAHCSLQTASSLRHLLEYNGFGDVCVEKNRTYSKFKSLHARRVLGSLGPLVVRVASYFPLSLSPNLWGHARKAPIGKSTKRLESSRVQDHLV